MARKKTAEPQPVEPEDESQEQPEEGGGQEGHGKVSKAEAIRRAIADGYDSPSTGPDYIKSTFGLDVSKAHFSASKSNFKKQDGDGGRGVTVKVKRGRKPREAASPAAERQAPRPANAVPASNNEAGLLETLESLKPLVASMGADKLRRLVDLLG